MANWLFCLFFPFLLLMFFQQSFDPAKLTESHHKCLPLCDIFITVRLNLHANAATDKRGCYRQGPGGQTQSIKLLVVGYHLTLDEFSAVNKITTNPLVLVCKLWPWCHSRPWETSLCSHQPEAQNPSRACGSCAIFGTIVNIWIIHLIIFLKTHLIPACLSRHTSAQPCSRDCWTAARYFLGAGDHRNCLSPQIRVTNQKQAVSSWTCVFPHLTLRCLHAMAWPSPFLLRLLLHRSASSTPGPGCHALRHSCLTQPHLLCGEAKIYWGQNLWLRSALVYPILDLNN